MMQPRNERFRLVFLLPADNFLASRVYMEKAPPVGTVFVPDDKIQYIAPYPPPVVSADCDQKKKDEEEKQAPVTFSDIYTIGLLLLVNLVNYADRYTVPSVLGSIQKAYHIEDDMIVGLLQTCFVITYMIFSPLFGYLGDRFNRRILMAIGLVAWASVSLASAFVDPAWDDAFWIFLTLRSLVGIGEASYVTISPTIISDLYVGRRRTIILLIYQSVMLMGSGLGYMVASLVAGLSGNWQYAFYVWPPVIYVCAAGLIFLKEPERGRAEGVTSIKTTSYFEDITYLLKIKSYVLCTLGYTSLVFVVGAIAFWAPVFAEYQLKMNNPDEDVSYVGFIFGFITIVGGVFGAVLGTGASKLMRRVKSIGHTSDAIACAIGGMMSGPLIYLTLSVSRYSSIGMWVMIFFSLTFLSVNLVLNQEITLYVMIPTRRATGGGMQILVSHLLGDAASPYIVGLLVDSFEAAAVADTNPPRVPNDLENFIFRQNALFMTTCVCVIGSFFYLICSLYVREDKDEANSMAKSLSRKSLANQMAESVVGKGANMPQSSTEIFELQPPVYSPDSGGIVFRPGTSAASSGYSSTTNLGVVTSPQVNMNVGSSTSINGYTNKNYSDGYTDSYAL